MPEDRLPDCSPQVLEGDICATILETLPVGVLVIDSGGRILSANGRIQSLLGYTREQLHGQSVDTLVPDGARAQHREHRDAFMIASNSRLMGRGRDVFARCRDGRYIMVEIALRPLRTEAGLLVVASIVDVSERRRLHDLALQASATLERRVRERTQKLESALSANQALLLEIEQQRAAFEQLSRQDPLTGLSNRRELERRLAEEVLRADSLGMSLSLALMDIDHFKSVNDRFGHAAGDLALQRAAALIRANTRIVDFAARHGGEEFAVIMPGIGIAEAREICQRVCNAFRIIDWHAIEPGLVKPVTISIGVGQWLPGMDSRAFVGHVDGLLYAAKRSGRDQVVAATDGGIEVEVIPLRSV